MVHRRENVEGQSPDPLKFTWKKGESRDVVLTRVQQLQRALFPEQIDAHDPFHLLHDSTTEFESKKPYIYFAPYHFFWNGTIDIAFLNKLKQGKTLLSVGSGCGLLEQMLRYICQTKPGQITVSDYFVNSRFAHHLFLYRPLI